MLILLARLLAALVTLVGLTGTAGRPSSVPAKDPSTTAITASGANGPGDLHSSATADHQLIFGIDADSEAQVLADQKILGRQLGGLRIYRFWGQRLFGSTELWMRDTHHTLFISVMAQTPTGQRIPFNSIAKAAPGSALYQQIVTMAGEIKSFGATVYFIFNHEPEINGRGSGNAASFVAAWRHIVTIFRQQGVHNARYVLTLTAWAFSSQSHNIGSSYYPGDAYVDDIGVDPYNWYYCHAGKWRSMSWILSGVVQFGHQHPTKGLMLMEWNSVEDSHQPGRKAAWIDAAGQLFKQPEYRQFYALLTWARTPGEAGCPFYLDSSGSALQAWVRMGNDPAYEATSIPR